MVRLTKIGAQIGNHMVAFDARVWQEGDAFVARVPSLEIASCGDDEADALLMLKEAVECRFDGEPDEVLREGISRGVDVGMVLTPPVLQKLEMSPIACEVWSSSYPKNRSPPIPLMPGMIQHVTYPSESLVLDKVAITCSGSPTVVVFSSHGN